MQQTYDRHTYRAKDKHGHWRYGTYHPATTDCAPYDDTPARIFNIRKNDIWEVDPNTAGQCSGEKDRKKTVIFEGDVVRWIDSDSKERVDIVVWMCGGLCLCNSGYTVGSYSGLEVIGNPWDNPELLEVTTDD